MMTKFTTQDLRELLVAHAEEYELDEKLCLNFNISYEEDAENNDQWGVEIWAWEGRCSGMMYNTTVCKGNSSTEAWDKAANQFVNSVPRKKSL